MIRIIVDRVLSILLLGSALLLALRLRWGDRWGWLGLLNAWTVWTQRLNVVAAGWLLWRGYPARSLLALPALATTVQMARPCPPRPAVGSDSFTILSANLYVRNPEIDRHIELAQTMKPDVLCLQELTFEFKEAFDCALHDRYPHRATLAHGRAYGLGIYSRFPLTESALWSEPGVRPWGQRVYVELPDQRRIALYNVHLCPPASASTLERGLTWGFRTREAQIEFLHAEIERHALPAIIIGDFNFSEGSDAYRMAVSQWQDGWRQAGSGPRWTWPTRLFLPSGIDHPPALLRLDYCFLSGGMQARALQHLTQRSGSDHRPLLATLEPPR